ncbi:MAG TPA: flagellar biosynthetic protein FliR [Azospirillum sp.]|nr:flagellar biosynthetic protein FliR [Azospirillum sp.]
MDLLAQMLSQEIYRVFLVFVRVAAAVGFLPGFGEFAVPVRARLAIAGVVALSLAPTVPGLPAAMPEHASEILRHFAGEIMVGAFLGLGAKLFLAALQVTGTVAAQTIGLANPFAIEGAGFEGGSVLSGTLVLAGLAAIFAADVHYVMLDALARSYGTWPVSEWPDVGLLAGRYSQLIAVTFRLGVGMATPFLVFGVLFNLALGLVNRVMPAMPVFFVGTPVMLATGLFILMATAAAMVSAFLAALSGWLAGG